MENNVKIINIEPSHERILHFLYPEYYIEDQLQRYDKFIVHRDIVSPSDKIKVEDNYRDCIIISTKIYNEFWGVEEIKQKVLDFARVNFKVRKRTLNELNSEDPSMFIDSLIYFMFTGEVDVLDEESMVEMFSVYGSVKFNEVFMAKCDQFPPQKVIASMMTFITKIINPGNSVFYKKKNSVLADKIKKNFESSFSYLRNYTDPNNLTYLYFFQSLIGL